jgi:hypothetical protein
MTKRITEDKPRKQVDIMRKGVEELTGERPTQAQIWGASRSKLLMRQERTFMFWTLNDAYKIGEYWTRIPSYKERGKCRQCGEIETMEHILAKCASTARKRIWRLAEDIFRQRTEQDWPGADYGTILASCMPKFKGETQEESQALNRFYTILMMTSAHLIWALRCESTIPQSPTKGPRTVGTS